MSRFYGTVKGCAPSIGTRRGGKDSGVTTHAAGWRGAIRVDVSTDPEHPDVDHFTVTLVPWKGSGGSSTLLASGTLDAEHPEQVNA